MGDDFAFGYEQIGGFQRVLEVHGGQIVKKLWSPLNTADYAPYVAQVPECDVVCERNRIAPEFPGVPEDTKHRSSPIRTSGKMASWTYSDGRLGSQPANANDGWISACRRL